LIPKAKAIFIFEMVDEPPAATARESQRQKEKPPPNKRVTKSGSQQSEYKRPAYKSKTKDQVFHNFLAPQSDHK